MPPHLLDVLLLDRGRVQTSSRPHGLTAPELQHLLPGTVGVIVRSVRNPVCGLV